MAEIRESRERIEISERMPVGLRVIVLILALVPLLAPYELLVVPRWERFGVALAVALLISLSALAVSALLAYTALYGLNQRLRFEGATRTIVYAVEAAILPLREFRYTFADVAGAPVNAHDWTEGPSTYGIALTFRNGRSVEVGIFDRQTEAEALLERIRALLREDP